MGKLRHKNMSNLDTNVGAEQPSAPVLKTCLSHLTIVAGMEEVREELKFQEILSKHEREPWAPESLWWQGLENAGREGVRKLQKRQTTSLSAETVSAVCLCSLVQIFLDSLHIGRERGWHKHTANSPPLSMHAKYTCISRPIAFPYNAAATGERAISLLKVFWIQNDLYVSEYVLSSLTFAMFNGGNIHGC